MCKIPVNCNKVSYLVYRQEHDEVLRHRDNWRNGLDEKMAILWVIAGSKNL